MSGELGELFQRFVERTPLPVMARAVLERSFNAEQLDSWFGEVAESQYERELLFSTVFELLTEVVLRQQPSVRSAYQHAREPIGVSLSAVYEKLKHTEPQLLGRLVDYSARESSELIGALRGHRQELLADVPIKIVDGNALCAREHRLKETRSRQAAPLPGKSLAVLYPQLGLITQLVPCEDAYTQERALIEQVFPSIQAGQCWLADRNFCTQPFLYELDQRGAWSLFREHSQHGYEEIGAWSERERIDNGWVSECRIRLGDQPDGLELRRISIELDTPTRDGDYEVYLWTTLSLEQATSTQVAALYLERWQIETAFLKLTVELRCELDTLGYPAAALFGFTVAVVVYNALAVVWAALRAGFDDPLIEQKLSSYHIALEMANTTATLMTMVDIEEWAYFRTLTAAGMAAWLIQCCAYVQMRKYQKAKPRGPKKAKPKRVKEKSSHVSVARLLNERQ